MSSFIESALAKMLYKHMVTPNKLSFALPLPGTKMRMKAEKFSSRRSRARREMEREAELASGKEVSSTVPVVLSGAARVPAPAPGPPPPPPTTLEHGDRAPPATPGSRMPPPIFADVNFHDLPAGGADAGHPEFSSALASVVVKELESGT